MLLRLYVITFVWYEPHWYTDWILLSKSTTKNQPFLNIINDSLLLNQSIKLSKMLWLKILVIINMKLITFFTILYHYEQLYCRRDDDKKTQKGVRWFGWYVLLKIRSHLMQKKMQKLCRQLCHHCTSKLIRYLSIYLPTTLPTTPVF